MATITITGLDKVLRRRIFDESRNMRDPLETSLRILQEYLAEYPAQRSGSYRRTGDLGRNWTISISSSTSNNLSGEVGNNVRGRKRPINYAPYVQSRPRQAWMHKGHWQTIEDAVEEKTQKIIDIFRHYASE